MTATVRDPQLLAAGMLRVWAGGEVAGAAFLVGPGLVATAASVLADAGATVWLDFPLLRDADDAPLRVAARVEIRPAGADGPVLLRLADALPRDVRMPPLRRVDRAADRTFMVLGFPEGLTDGLWSTGRIGPDRQLHRAPGEPVIDGGFAGAPVWEADTAAVIGMVVPGGDAPRMVPIDDVLGHDPERLPGPYQGLRPFDEEHADTFFGRDEEITRLTDLVARRPVVAVAGPSGAGKSSLVRAGLVPRLRAAGTEVAYVRVGEGQATAASLPDAGEHELVMVLDQFEELAALDPAAARELLAAVVEHTDPRHGRKVRAVLTLRWNSLDELSTPEVVDALAGGTVLIGPLGREQLREAIVEPARRPPGLGFEPGLVETILDDAGAEPGRLPLVESLLAQLWERREGGFLTMAGYTAAGGVAGALARHADEVVDGMPPGSSDALRRLLTALARPDRDGRLVRRPVPVDQLPADQEALLAGLTAGRLVTVSSSAGSGDVVDLAHQALLEHWPRLRNWLEADREFLAWREKVDAQRERWESEDRDDAALLRGAALAGAGEWLPSRAADLTAADRDYLRRSTAHRRREVRRWQLVAAVLGVLAIGAAVLTAVTVSSGNAIADQLTVANADALGRVAQARAAQDPAEAAQLALAAWRADPRNPQARAALLQSYVALRGVERELPGLTAAPITDLLVGGDTAVLVAAPHPVVVTGLSGPDPRHRELTGVPFDRPLAVSPDGRWLAVQKPDLSGIELRELAGDGPAIPLPATPGTEAAGARFTPDSTRLSWVEVDAANRATVRIREIATGAEVPHALGVLSEDASAVTLTTDPNRVLVRRGQPDIETSRLVVRALSDGAELATLPEGAQSVLDGAAFATCEPSPQSLPTTATLVVTPFDGSTPRRIPLTVSCTGHHLSGDGRALLEPDAVRTFRLTDLRTGESVRVTVPEELPLRFLSGSERALTVGVVDGDRGALLAFGTSLLRLRADPLPPAVTRGPGEIVTSITDEHYLVDTRTGFTTVGPDGSRLGEVSGINERGSTAFSDSNTLWNGQLTPGGWHLTGYDLPQLRPTTEIALPPREGGPPRGAVPRQERFMLERSADGPLIALADGVLSAWDPATGRGTGPPVQLGETDGQIRFLRAAPFLLARPGHPGQVALLSNEDVQIWDTTAGQLVARIPTSASTENLTINKPLAFDVSGERLAVLTRDRTVQIWDVATLRQTRQAVPAPTTTSLVGATSDGYLATVGDGRIAFVDLETGVVAGAVHTKDQLSTLIPQGINDTGDVLGLQAVDDLLRLEIPATGQGWRDALCATFDRPFTPAEAALLPPGLPADPPCS